MLKNKGLVIIIVGLLVVSIVLSVVSIVSFKSFEKEYWTQNAKFLDNYTKMNSITIMGLAAIGQKVKVTKDKMDFLVPAFQKLK